LIILQGLSPNWLTAGPLICKDGKPYGSLLILDFKMRSELDDFLEE
jgi:uncharacterized protein YciI